ncbi:MULTISPECIES: ATP-binding protein [Glutamicibacter]
MKIKDRLLNLVGLGVNRRLPPPHYKAIAPGLLVTTTKAEAWFSIRTANTDTQSEARRDAQLENVLRRVTSTLRGVECHLKIVWGRVSGDDYVEDAATFYKAGDWERWVNERADRIDDLAIPERYIMIGVTLNSSRQENLKATAADGMSDVLGLSTGGSVSEAELLHYQGQMKKIGRQLRKSDLGATVAPSSLIAWMISREQRREISPAAPSADSLTGASLSRLSMGRVLPYADHLRFYDANGEVASYGRILILSSFPAFYESTTENPWLLSLSNITRIGENEEDMGYEVPVIADASTRFKVLAPGPASKTLEEAAKLAREQRRSAAKGVAEEPAEEWKEAEENLRQMVTDIRRDGVSLIEHHTRIMVTGRTYEELEMNSTAVINHYSDSGITASIGEDEQRDLWLEMQPGDQLRVQDLGNLQTDVMFFSSWFWGGSQVGQRHGAPVIGTTTGSTQSLVRFDALGGGQRGDATTTAMLGRSGRGKTTLIQLAELDAAFRGAWVNHIDFKCEAAGVSHAASSYGLESQVIRVGSEHSGAFDLFHVFGVDRAKTQVARQLSLMASHSFSDIAETATLAGAEAIAATENPTTWDVIQWLCAHDNEAWRNLGRSLETLAKTHVGSIVAGKPSGKRVLREEPGLWVIQMPDLTLPSAESDFSSWDVEMRLGLVAMRAVMAHTLKVAGNPSLREMPKLVSIPEVHRMLRVADGRDFLDQIARMGRATDTNMMLDSQDVVGIAAVEGIVEQLSSVFGFQMTTPAQQDALASLLHLPVEESTRTLIHEIGLTEDENGDPDIRKGHPIYRDFREQAATIQVDLPTAEIAAYLSTSPDATANVVDLETEEFEDLDIEEIKDEVPEKELVEEHQ